MCIRDRAGKLLRAGSDEKYQVVAGIKTTVDSKTGAGYKKISDAKEFIGVLYQFNAVKMGVNDDNVKKLNELEMCIRDSFKTGDYYFGDENDGAMTVGWLQMDITYDEATSDYEFAPVFNEDEDQTLSLIHI